MTQPERWIPGRPLSDFKGCKALVGRGAAKLAAPPIHAAMVNIIAAWAHVDECINRVATFLMRAEHQIIAAMFSAMNNRGARRSAIFSAALIRLGEKDAGLLRATLQRVAEASEVRDWLAHWLVGIGRQSDPVEGEPLPSPHLLVADTAHAGQAAADTFRQAHEFVAAIERFNKETDPRKKLAIAIPDIKHLEKGTPIDQRHIRVLTLQDLEDQEAYAWTAYREVENLVTLAGGIPNTADQARQRLLEKPLTKHLSELQRRGPQAAQTPPRESPPQAPQSPASG